MSLTSPAIGSGDVMQSVKILLLEWLQKYFDGNAHDLTSGSRTFHRVKVCFDISPTDKTQVLPIIRVMMRPGRSVRRRDSEGWRLNQAVTLQFYIQVPQSTSEAGAKELVANQVSGELALLLCDALACYELGQKGFRVLVPRQPEVLSSMDFATRLVVCNAQASWIQTEP